MKTCAHYLLAAALAAAALPLASPARAEAVACGMYRPGLLTGMTGVRPALCAYQGDRIAQQGPTYDGPAVIAPQPTYSPSPYVYGGYREGVVRHATVTRVKRVASKARDGKSKGNVDIVRARGEVRIYGSERMEIRLYREH